MTPARSAPRRRLPDGHFGSKISAHCAGGSTRRCLDNERQKSAMAIYAPLEEDSPLSESATERRAMYEVY
jgi:hypothetical protein